VSEAEAEIALGALAEGLRRISTRLSALESLVLAAVALDLADDSRSLGKAFAVGHAPVLRAIAALSEAPALLEVVRRDPRTQRSFLALAAAGAALAAATGAI
jgi:hypothetical protein